MKKRWSLLLGMFLAMSAMACSNDNESNSEQKKNDTPPAEEERPIVRTTPPIRVVCVGNSITAGYGSTSEATAWPSFLNQLLGSGYAVANCGVSGTTMFKNSDAPYWKTERFSIAKETDPQILIIALGTNDADPWRWNQLKQEFKPDYLDMVAEFRKNGKDPIVYVCLPPPLFGSGKSAQNTVVEVELIPRIEEIAKEIGAYVIDYHQPLLNASDKFPDTVHPDDAGAKLMGQIAYGYLKEAQCLQPKASVDKGEIIDGTTILVEEGGSVTLAPEPADGTWQWNGPDAFSATQRVITLDKVKAGGVYSAIRTDAQGNRSIINYLVSIKGQTASELTAAVKSQAGMWVKSNFIRVNPGGDIVLGPTVKSGEAGTWSWSGPNNSFAGTRELALQTILPSQAGEYTATFTDKRGRQNSIVFTVAVEGAPVCPELVPYINYGGWQKTYEMEVKQGDNVTFGPHPSNGSWSWTGPDGFMSNRREATVSGFNSRKAGSYTGTFTNAVGCKVQLVLTLKLKEQ